MNMWLFCPLVHDKILMMISPSVFCFFSKKYFSKFKLEFGIPFRIFMMRIFRLTLVACQIYNMGTQLDRSQICQMSNHRLYICALTHTHTHTHTHVPIYTYMHLLYMKHNSNLFYCSYNTRHSDDVKIEFWVRFYKINSIIIQ